VLTETGRVVGLEGDTVWVETLRQSTCGACSARSGCGHGLLNSARPGSSRALVRARVERDLIGELELQDSVEIALPERSFLRAAALMYVAPLAAAIVAALGAEHWFAGGAESAGSADLATVLGAVGGLAAGFLIVRWLGARQPATEFLPVVTARR
jgi:sigma-E factor negative regulatory protein RseC